MADAIEKNVSRETADRLIDQLERQLEMKLAEPMTTADAVMDNHLLRCRYMSCASYGAVLALRRPTRAKRGREGGRHYAERRAQPTTSR